MRPNSPPQITSVSSSSPRCFRSFTSAAHGCVGVLALDLELRVEVAVLVPAGVHSCTKRTPRSDQPAGHQAVVGEAALALHVGAVHLEDVLAARWRNRSAPARSSACW